MVKAKAEKEARKQKNKGKKTKQTTSRKNNTHTVNQQECIGFFLFSSFCGVRIEVGWLMIYQKDFVSLASYT